MQLLFSTLVLAYFSIFGCSSRVFAFPSVDAVSIAARTNNNQGVKTQLCGDPRVAKPLYRMWQPTVKDHFYTIDEAEYDRAAKKFGYTKEGIAGYIFPKQQPSTAPLFRLWDPTVSDHFYTMSVSERDGALKGGYVNEGVAGYVYTPASGPFCGGKPFYRLYNGPITDHFYTMSEEERIGSIVKFGYTDEGVVGWILPY